MTKDSMSTQESYSSQLKQPESVFVLGVRVDRASQEQVLDSLIEIIKRKHEAIGGESCQQVITVNVEFIMAAQHSVDFRKIINSAAFVIADGMGVVWATRYLKRAVPERITGVDTLVSLAQRCASYGYSLYLLGAAPGVAEAAASRLQNLAPDLKIAGTYAGSPKESEEEAIIERIRASQADVLCVAYGAPAQEFWIARNLSRLPVALAIGVGGAYDFISGRQRRAPQAMQRLGLEWLYRLYREPWRWRRMLALPRFAVRVIVKGRDRHGQ